MGEVRSFLIERMIDMNKRQQNLFNNLVSQIERVKKENVRQGSSGKDRYETSQRNFAKHLATKYGSQSFKNIRDQHIESFLKERIERDDVTLTTLKNDLSAIRKLHVNVNAKNEISENKVFEDILSSARVGASNDEIDRAWTEDEYNDALSVAENMPDDRSDVINALKMARHFGTRVEEVVRLNKQQLREALNKGYLHLKITKNNIPRDIPVENEQQREALQEVLNNAKNERIFVTHNRTYTQAMQRIQDWVYNHRDKFQDKATQVGHREKSDCTFHGLRHKYAREQYNKNVRDGLTERQARIQVSHKLGHGRDEVTKIYL